MRRISRNIFIGGCAICDWSLPKQHGAHVTLCHPHSTPYRPIPPSPYSAELKYDDGPKDKPNRPRNTNDREGETACIPPPSPPFYLLRVRRAAVASCNNAASAILYDDVFPSPSSCQLSWMPRAHRINFDVCGMAWRWLAKVQ